MADAYYETLMAAVGEATILAHLLDEKQSVTPAGLGRARSMVERLQEAVSDLIRDHPESTANADAHLALEAMDDFRAAGDGGDIALMRAAAHAILDRVAEARDAAAPVHGDVALAGARGGEAPSGPRRRWKFGSGVIEEAAPPPASPEEEPSFGSAAIERSAEAHFTPGPEEE